MRARAIGIGLALTWLCARWIFWGEFSRYTFVTIAVPFAHAIFLLMLLTTANLAVRRRAPAAALTRHELLAIYAMVSVSSALMSTDLLGILITLIGYPAYYGDAGNGWAQLFEHALPAWLLVGDRSVLAGFYQGNSRFLTMEHVRAWAAPLGAWCLFAWALLIMMACASVLLRRAWVEQERLTFPIVALPLAMTDDTEPFFRNRLMWAGFAIAAGITVLNGISVLFPQAPSVPIKRVPYQFVESGPLEAASRVTISFYFFAISLGFTMPLNLSFSLWVFYILYRVELACVAMMGWGAEGGAPYAEAQAFGAYVAVFCAAVWRIGPHLRAVWRSALARDGAPPHETAEYRLAIAGFVLSFAFLVAFAWRAGMAPGVACAYFAIFLAVSVMVTRVRAEFGFPVHDLHRMGPTPALVRACGSEAFGPSTLGMFALFHWMSRAYRSHPMPHQLEALRLAGPSRSAARSMLIATTLAGAAAFPICAFVYLVGFYRIGAATANVNMWGTGFAIEAFRQNLQAWLKAPAPALWGDQIATAAGFCIALLLSGMRRAFVGWPLHPLAYAVANSWGMANLWLPILIGSVCKFSVLRARGRSGYESALRFFFGLMLGEFAAGCCWSIAGMVFDARMYEFWP